MPAQQKNARFDCKRSEERPKQGGATRSLAFFRANQGPNSAQGQAGKDYLTHKICSGNIAASQNVANQAQCLGLLGLNIPVTRRLLQELVHRDLAAANQILEPFILNRDGSLYFVQRRLDCATQLVSGPSMFSFLSSLRS